MRSGILPGSRGLVLAGWLAAVLAAEGDAADPSPPARPFGLTRRIPWTTSHVVGSPEPPPPYRLARVFPRLKFNGPVCIAQEPGTDRLLIAENNGKIFAFPMDQPDVAKADLFFDMKRPIYAFSFHPKYRENGQVFVFSPTPAPGSPNPEMSRVSRFQTNLEDPRRINPDSERVIIQWLAGGHNGGEAIIGPDGYLYISTGDGTSGSDVNNSGQGVDDLHSVIMRLDVDHPEPGRPYAIPKDNPFVNFQGARPEIWAHGFRNPWRMSFDPETGRLWVGDVGQDLWEMVWVVRKGGNYGWSVQEGTHPFHPNSPVGPGPILPPVVEHHHTECRSITGGYVYHGAKFPELRGAYIYGDYQYGKIWALRYDGEKVTWHKELADTAVYPASFAVSRDGAFYAVDNTTGFIHALERAPAGPSASAFPRTLGETGLFASVKDRRIAPGVIPYSVNAPYWADGAHAQRFLGLPGTAQLADANSWNCPDGTVMAQTLSLDREAGNPATRAPIETRILVKQDEHWMGYSYLWNDAGTDAALVGRDGVDHVLAIKDRDAPGGVRRQTWRVPGRSECMFCHSRAANFVLGLSPSQMNRDHTYGDVVDNQIRALDHIGIFKSPAGKSFETMARFVDPYDPKADLNQRARTYLHVNCSICHVSDGGGNSFIELAYGNTLEATKLVNGPPAQGAFGIGDAKIVAPGAPEHSVLFYRIASLGGSRMPRVGSRVVDETAVAMFADWIGRMPHPDESTALKAEREETASLLKSLRGNVASSPGVRAEAVRRLTASTSRTLALARAMGESTFPAAVRREVANSTKDHPATEVRDLLERFLPESERIRRLGDVIDPRMILGLKGDPARGRALFAAESAVNCRSCHRLDGVGIAVGPDLAKIGAKYPREELLRQILEPSRSVDPKYTLYQLVATSGLIHSGLLVERNAKEVILRDTKNQENRVPLADIDTLVPQKQSLMPDLLLRGLTAQQAADLLDYLGSHK